MNSVEKELRGYINGTEAMSGFDSYDSYEGEYGYFDDADGDYDYMDGDNPEPPAIHIEYNNLFWK